jgi:parallel beta-helix repeat protein
MAKRPWTRVGLPVLLVAGVFLVPEVARAAEGRIPLFAPGPITASGKYVLTRNIVGDGSDTVISVQAPQVEIDLNGFTISNDNGSDCISVATHGIRLAVRNGTLTSCHSGVFAGAAYQLVVEDVTVIGTWGPSINVHEVASIAIRRVNVLGAGTDAIAIFAPSINHSAVIEDCMVKDTGSTGILFNGGTVRIRNNRVISSGDYGIRVFEARGSEISGNLVVELGSNVGIVLAATHGSTIQGNTVRFAALHGIWLAADASSNVVRDNVATSNGAAGPGNGLYVQGTSNQVEGNTLNGNGGAGLLFGVTGCGNTFGRNMARGNAGSGASGCTALFPPDSFDQCSVGPANTSFGDNLIPGPPVF